jgi:hypothetical protein
MSRCWTGQCPRLDFASDLSQAKRCIVEAQVSELLVNELASAAAGINAAGHKPAFDLTQNVISNSTLRDGHGGVCDAWMHDPDRHPVRLHGKNDRNWT